MRSHATAAGEHHATAAAAALRPYLRAEVAPEEGGLHEAHLRAAPTVLLGHGQDCYSHVHAVHVAQHEGDKAEAHDGPPGLPGPIQGPGQLLRERERGQGRREQGGEGKG